MKRFMAEYFLKDARAREIYLKVLITKRVEKRF